MKRISWIIFWILTAVSVASAQTTFYYPHVANGLVGGTVWRTTILLTNPASSGTASGTITLFRENAASNGAGSVFNNIVFVDQDGAPAGSGGVIPFSIGAGQTRKYTSSGAGAYSGGFATVVTTEGSVGGTAKFSAFDVGGRLIAEAGVPAASAVPNQAIFVDTQGGFNIGVAFANPGAAAADVTLSLLNSSAASVATTTQILGPGNHSASFTFQMFPGAPQVAGTMQLRSSAPLAAIALLFDPTLSIFTTLPPVNLASLVTPAVNWFEQRPWFAPLTSVARLLAAFQLRVG